MVVVSAIALALAAGCFERPEQARVTSVSGDVRCVRASQMHAAQRGEALQSGDVIVAHNGEAVLTMGDGSFHVFAQSTFRVGGRGESTLDRWVVGLKRAIAGWSAWQHIDSRAILAVRG